MSYNLKFNKPKLIGLRGGHFFPPNEPVYPAPELGPLITKLYRGTKLGEDITASSAVLTNFQAVSSYTWTSKCGEDPVIMVPGKPPVWSPKPGIQNPKRDQGIFYRDVNSASYPGHPMEAAVLAMFEMCGNNAFENVDLVGCCGTIGNLLRFANVSKTSNIPAPRNFRMLVEEVGGVVFFIKRENDPLEYIKNIKGYGHSYPADNLKWEYNLDATSTHYRMNKCRFGGINFVIRSKCDGHFADNLSEDGSSASSVDSLIEAFQSAKIKEHKSGDFTILQRGTMVPRESLLDIKTRSRATLEYTNTDVDTIRDMEMHNLWISGLSNFILALHNWGVFAVEDTCIHDITAEKKQWEDEHVQSLKRLASLIHLIIKTVKQRDDKKLEVVCVEPVNPNCEAVLELREQLADAGTVLTKATRADFLQKRLKTTRADDCDEVGEANDATTYSVDYETADSKALDYTACDRECGYCGRCEYDD